MDINKALGILEIDTTQIDYKYLKKKYYKLALRYHPDKNTHLPEACEKFQKINEAYHFLCKELNLIDEQDINLNESSSTEKEDSVNSSTIYMDLLNMFMKGVFEGKYNNIIFNIIQEIVSGCQKISIKLFEDLDKDTCLKIYSFLVNYRNILHLNDNILVSVREIVQQKFSNVIIYRLNPSINDMIHANIFKLTVLDEICYVPLWINESYFEVGECEVITLCEPELPENITIDEYNNLYIERKVSIKEELCTLLQNNLDLEINVGEKVFEIPTNELKIQKEQIYVLKNKGILKTDELELTASFKKADIIVTIKLQ
jgi:curved DNA-binding protein CbpA